DPDWTLVTHRLVETYGVKEAVPLLAAEALGTETDEMGGDMNGRPFMWSRRTMAMGALCKLVGKEGGGWGVYRSARMGDAGGVTGPGGGGGGGGGAAGCAGGGPGGAAAGAGGGGGVIRVTAGRKFEGL